MNDFAIAGDLGCPDTILDGLGLSRRRLQDESAPATLP